MSRRFTSYPSYCDSGVDWIGQVPIGWTVLATARVSDLTTGNCDTQDAEKDGAYPFFVRSQTVERISSYSFDGEGVLTSGDGAGVGKIFHHHIGRFEIHQRVYLFHNFRRIIGRFFFYFFREHLHRVALAGNAKSTVDSLRRPMLRMFPICLPSVEEQERITEFLDYETTKIDALIEKQQQLIALLKEKRQAVISHAVTKGLNPDAPMRDSGVEWLGEIPTHWTVSRLKHTCEIQSGMPKGRPASATTVDMPMLRVANVQDGWLNLDDVHRIPIERNQVARYLLRNGDVLMNEGGDRDKLGRGTIWRCEVPICIHQNHVFAIRPLSIEPEWLDAVTRADYAKFHFFLVAKQSTNLASISSSSIKETPLVVPPVTERKEILNHIEIMTAKTSTTIELAGRQNMLLIERRTALISAAVTGKIDVRNWKAPNPQPQTETP